MIIIGYPGIGKSTIARNNKQFIDLESSNFWHKGVRHPDWYIYYCKIAMYLSKAGFTVFVSSHEVVYMRLKKYCKESICAIIPSIELSYEWRMKLKERWEHTRLEKDYKSWTGSEMRFESNIQKIIESGIPCYEIRSMDYDLMSIIEKINPNQLSNESNDNAKKKPSCRYCDYDSEDNEIYIDPMCNDWYMDHQTGFWDEREDGFIHERIYINYCPWCGRKL